MRLRGAGPVRATGDDGVSESGPYTIPATLDVRPGQTPFAVEHARLVRQAVHRNQGIPPRGPRLDALEGEWSQAARQVARENWRRRMVHEHKSAAVFASLVPFFIEANLPIELKTSVARMAIDELFHSELCGRVVEALGGEATAMADLHLEPLPAHLECPPVERALRNALFASCLSETVSMALLTAELERCTEPFVREVIKQLTSDEVSHARLGWTVFDYVWPQLDAAGRERTNDYLRVAVPYLRECMLDAMPLRPVPAEVLAEVERLGVSDSNKARHILADTLADVILPRFAASGLDVAGLS